jgi:hypothetical protein
LLLPGKRSAVANAAMERWWSELSAVP